MKYKRVLLKLSGESLIGSQQFGIDNERLNHYAKEIKSIIDHHIELAIVVGGGNIYRGLTGVSKGMDRVQGDYMGMMATIINCLALQSAFEKINMKTRHFSSLAISPIAEPMSSRRAISALKKGEIVIISGGTGNPFFTTDTASALRAVEIKADLILKGTRVDGIYSSDPEKDPKAVKLNKLTFDEVYLKKLKIMDLTALTLCKENKLPIIVFDINKKGNLYKVLKGESIGSIVT